jgi:hypothetical protein
MKRLAPRRGEPRHDVPRPARSPHACSALAAFRRRHFMSHGVWKRYRCTDMASGVVQDCLSARRNGIVGVYRWLQSLTYSMRPITDGDG